MCELFYPPPLQKGGRVALIAPASPPENSDLVSFAAAYIKSLGLVPVMGESCNAAYGYLAGDDDLRARDVNWAFSDESISGVFCLRGGYGIQRILDKIDFEMIKQNPKVFCGYSDVTALHTAINQKSGFITFHTPMPATPGFVRADSYTLNKFKEQIFEPGARSLENPQGYEWRFLTHGKAEGALCGGNLSIIASSMGTPYEMDTRGKIIFIEEVEEQPYKIDRMLNQMRLADKFGQAAGVVFGDFADCIAPEPEKSLDIVQIINNLKLTIPVLYNFRCGHCYPNASLPMGAMAQLNSATNSFDIV
ncbi:MAG: LD-carboxypeptidase [Defluviitaleaceae bacterium]|nr:LD-carboxypeptidase [Defluviitaleaceae bacterium]